MKALRAIAGAALIAALVPSAAAGAGASSAQGGVSDAGANGGATYGEPVARQPAPKPKRPSMAARPVLEAFTVSPTVINPGQMPTVSFRVKGRAPTIRLRLVITSPDNSNLSRQVDLGRLPANMPQSLDLSALADPSLPEGDLQIRIAGRDSAGRILRPRAHLSRVAQLQVRAHVFPLRGVFSYGGAGASFGAARSGRSHQGQDLLAAEGIPVVAPRSGVIEYVAYQPQGAGWYVILDGDGEDFDYAFMHLVEGSIPVTKGEHVDQGQRLGSVGHTGAAEGDQLHFEIWQGQWWGDAGKPVDPYPSLQQWQQWSPVRAT